MHGFQTRRGRQPPRERDDGRTGRESERDPGAGQRMSNSDVLLHRNRVEVVATDGAGLAVTTEEGADPDATLRPNWATLTLGGGDGDKSDGDVQLLDRDGHSRIHLDGEGNGPADEATTHAWIDGRNATFELGRGDERDPTGTIEVWGSGEGDNGPRAEVVIDGGSADGDPSIGLNPEAGTNELHIEPDGIDMYFGDIRDADRVEATAMETRTLTAGYIFGAEGDFEFEPGKVSVLGDTGFEDDQTETVTIEGAPEAAGGGVISVTDDSEFKTVEIRGDRGLVKLGMSTDLNELPTGREVPLPGNNGQLLIDDGDNNLFEVTADAGVFSISDRSAGETLFEIDTDNRRIATKYSIDEGAL